MTSSSDRLDRMESLLERFIETSVANQREIQQLVTSNSRSIQALSDEFVEHKLTTAEERQELREAIQRLTTLNEGVFNLLSSLDEDRPTILRKLNSIENKVDRLLERGNGEQPQP